MTITHLRDLAEQIPKLQDKLEKEYQDLNCLGSFPDLTILAGLGFDTYPVEE